MQDLKDGQTQISTFKKKLKYVIVPRTSVSMKPNSSMHNKFMASVARNECSGNSELLTVFGSIY